MAGAAAAKEPTVRTAEAAPADEIFEIEDIPEGVDLGKTGDKPEAEEPAEAEKPEIEEPVTEKAEAAKKPAKKPTKEEDRLPASTREEREKRKKYAKLWEETEAEKEKLEAQLRAARGQQSVASSKLTTEQRAALKEKANKAETMGDLLEIALEEIERRDARMEHAIGEERFNRFLHVSESIARGKFDKYDLVLKEAGILDAVAVKDNGQFADPAVANKIYRSGDPGEMAYRLALGKLEREGRLDEVIGKTQEKGETVVEDDDEPEPEPKGKGKSEKASDERRAGAREVIEAVSGNSSKPRGLSALKQAAPPKRGVTRKDLDRMSEEDPNGLATLFKAQPKLKEWWLGGVEVV